MNENKKTKDHLGNIIHNYENLEADIVKQLTFKWDPHGATIGSNRENVWKELFERIVPKKFKIANNVFIIDAQGNCSAEIDLAIFDEEYTPYIFKHGVLKFIPIEAVVAVIECKSDDHDAEKFTSWLEKMDALKTSQGSIARIAGRIAVGSDDIGDVSAAYLNTQTATRPIKILCYISSTKDVRHQPKEGFDIILEANKNKEKLDVSFHEGFENLFDWYMALNHTENSQEKIKEFLEVNQQNKVSYQNKPIASIENLKEHKLDKFVVGQKEENRKTNLLSFIFQFNQLLMLINNPIFFPHLAYVKMFNEYLNPSIQETKEGEEDYEGINSYKS